MITFYSLYHGFKKLFDKFELNFSYSSKIRFVVGAFWFTDNLKVAKSYGKYIYESNLEIINPYVVDANFENYSEIYLSDLPKEIGLQIDILDNRMPGDTLNELKYRKQSEPDYSLRFDTSDLALAAMRAGYGSLIVKNIIDAGNKSALKIFQTTFAVFNNNKITIKNVNTKDNA
jgi:hypothetical protein